jgi:hypothetical protein
MPEGIPFKLYADEDSIAAAERAAATCGTAIEASEAPGRGQAMDFVAAAAVVVFAKDLVELAKLLVETWKEVKPGTQMTVAAPTGSVPLKADPGKTVDQVLTDIAPLLP